jgi:hypothetical protein
VNSLLSEILASVIAVAEPVTAVDPSSGVEGFDFQQLSDNAVAGSWRIIAILILAVLMSTLTKRRISARVSSRGRRHSQRRSSRSGRV